MGTKGLKKPEPFAYPLKPHVRRHGPMGYSHYREYRNWLRDEFTFRCVYCLRRETWLTLRANWEIDHFLPKSDRPDVARDYDNLVYACSSCNRTKASKYLPDPEKVAFGDCVRVHVDGTIHWLNERGRNLVEALALDDEDYTALRRTIVELVKEARIGGKLYEMLFGFPDSLPDLSVERAPPQGNRRPDGVNDSWFERSKRRDFVPYY